MVSWILIQYLQLIFYENLLFFLIFLAFLWGGVAGKEIRRKREGQKEIGKKDIIGILQN
uniref:Uncharacterized protein n=1 Tax=Rhizophora mucronata TaxID=61149 RepID=A0A2P2JTT6_RHIMU